MVIHFIGEDTYRSAQSFWNVPGAPMFVGVTPISDGLAYMKGQIYTCRLYQNAIDANDVKENYEKTLQYRELF